MVAGQASCSTTLSSLLSSNFNFCSSHPPPPSGFQLCKLRCTSQQGGGGSTSKLSSIIHERKATSFNGVQHDHHSLTLNEYVDVIPTDHLPLIKWPHHEVDKSDKVRDGVERIKSMLSKMKDGDITVSPYDTAWVALVEEIDSEGKKKKRPQFPESLEWISNHQLRDGSWGDAQMFQAHDRILNTLACVVALTSWNLHPRKCLLGMQFLKKNLSKLGEEKEEHMPIGFEVAFPSLIEIAERLGIHLLDHTGAVQHIYAKRIIKLSRIPLDLVHRKATTLLHSLEGMSGLNWEKLIKLQSKDGSFLFSPSSTAYALMNTKDMKCLSYLHTTLQKFNGGVPNVYPVDLFEHIWVVDRLQRLGISRFFHNEINSCMDYVYKNWTEKGICWARDSDVQDIDDTAMGFRLLRLHGYDVSADVFKNFKKDGEFICFAGQSTQAVTGMFNLYRASQMQYPGETILQEARDFSSKYLTQKQASNQLLDKWIIQKDLPGEVGFALDMPWYASLPRIEARFYVEQYGGGDDVWIGKTLYRMPNVSNNSYLELAKLDYNSCQEVHLREWNSVKRWYIDYNLDKFGLSERELLRIYFVATASIFEPERSKERLAWAKTSAMVTAIESCFSRQTKESYKHRKLFAENFFNSYGFSTFESKEQGLMGPLLSTLQQLSFDVLVAHGVDIHHHLRQAWGIWMLKWAEDGDVYKGDAELIARTIQICNKCCLESAEEERFGYNLLLESTNRVSHQLRHVSLQNDKDKNLREVDSEMQRLMELVYSRSSDVDINIRQSFMVVARAKYYSAYCSPKTFNSHLAKVLFERVI